MFENFKNKVEKLISILLEGMQILMNHESHKNFELNWILYFEICYVILV
jgi:hypothetical protein